MSNTKKRPAKEQLSIHQEMKAQRLQAIEISKNHIDVKPIKYYLK